MKRIATIIGIILLSITLLVLEDIRYYDSKTIEKKTVDKTALVDSLVRVYDAIDSIADPYKTAYLSLIDSVRYPGVQVDKITIQRMYNPIDMIFPRNFDKSNIASFDKFVNDSANFEFVETTFDKVDYVIKMYCNSKLVSRMWIGKDCKTINCIPMNPRIKYGMINHYKMSILEGIIK